MPKYVAFLRGINLGARTVKNTELVKIFAAAGLPDAEPFIASGNVIFDSRITTEKTLVGKIEGAIFLKMGFESRTFIRSMADLVKVAGVRPFAPARHASALAYVVGFVDAPFTAAQKKMIASFTSPDDELHPKGRELYWLSQTRQSDSLFQRIPFDKKVCASTWRNMNTVQRIVEKYGG
jgi:uncharacterized protein (DUF1697 family)